MPESAIVINTGPILALIAATGDLSLLPKLYSRVIVPREVCDEVLANGGTMFGAPEFASADRIERRTEPVEIGSLLSQLLDRGEASVVLTVDKNIEDNPHHLEKNLGRDLKLIEKLPTKIKELSVLMDTSEKTTGKERAAITKRIRDRNK